MQSLTVPRVLFDTNVFVDAANGALRQGPIAHHIPPPDWSAVASYVNRNFLHAVSPVTVVELLTGVAQGKSAYFQQNVVALRKLRDTFKPHVHLPYSHHFTLREVFAQEAPYPPELEDDFDTVADIVLSANTPSELRQKRVQFRDQRAGVRLEGLLRQRQDQNNQYLELAMDIRNRDRSLTRENWAATILNVLKLERTDENLRLVNERMDMCFYIEKYGYAMARNRTCKLEKIPNVLMDINQVNYLAAPDLLLITRDKPILRAASQSTQGARVLSWESFLTLAKQNTCL